MNRKEAAAILASAAALDDRIPPLRADGPDERVEVWHKVLEPLDYQTTDQALVELARDPGLVKIRPGDIYQATRRLMRQNLARTDIDRIQPPEDMDVGQFLAWRKALTRAVGRGTEVDAAITEADLEAGVTRRQIGPAQPRSVKALIEATPIPAPAEEDEQDGAGAAAELEQIRQASEARGLDDTGTA